MTNLNLPLTARVTIYGSHYQTSQVSSERIGLRNCTDSGEELFFTNDEFLALLDEPQVCIDLNYFGAKPVEQVWHKDIQLSDMSEEIQKIVHWRMLWIVELFALIQTGTTKRTDRSIAQVLPQLVEIVRDIYERQQLGTRADRAGAGVLTFRPPKASTLRKWLRRYEKGGNFEKGLIPKQFLKRKSKGSTYRIELEAIIAKGLKAYQSTQRPTQMKIVGQIQSEARELNRERSKAGLKPFSIPGETSIKRRIRKLDKYQTACKRFGVKYANDKFALYDGGLDLLYPLERIEIDEWKIDLISILAKVALICSSTQEQLEPLKKVGDGQRS